MGDRVLVTGADGFIGSHLTEVLVEAGYRVRALALYNASGSWGWLDQIPEETRREIEVVLGDVRDSHNMRSVTAGCQAVLHLAALVGIPYSYHSPESYVATNVSGTLNMLQAARAANVQHFLHTSTSEVYGSARYVPIDEEHPQCGQSPYAATKIGADQIALSFHRSFAVPVTIIRPFNTYGPRQSARAVIPSVIAQIASGRDRIELGSLEPTRDFTYVTDTVQGFLAALESDAGLGEIINLGTGVDVSIGDVAMLISKLMNTEVEIISDVQRVRPEASEVDRLRADTTKAGRLLNWEPTYVGSRGFREGLEETIKWFTEYEHLAHYKSDLYQL